MVHSSFLQQYAIKKCNFSHIILVSQNYDSRIERFYAIDSFEKSMKIVDFVKCNLIDFIKNSFKTKDFVQNSIQSKVAFFRNGKAHCRKFPHMSFWKLKSSIYVFLCQNKIWRFFIMEKRNVENFHTSLIQKFLSYLWLSPQKHWRRSYQLWI